MVERKHDDSAPDLLAELEDGWATPAPPPGYLAKSPSASSSELDDLDKGWLDDFLEEEDEEEEEEEEAEPELPDERLDPEAFALAKKAREERAAKKKERKRVKAEAKRARQKARATAMRQKQKVKKGRAGRTKESPQEAARATGKRRDRISDGAPRDGDTPTSREDESETEEAEEAALDTLRRAAKPRARPAAAPRRTSTIASVKVLAIVLAGLLALAALAFAILK